MFAIFILFAIVLVMAFALKDVYTSDIEPLYKILWTIVILAFPILGVCAYYMAKAFGVHKDPRITYRERFYEKANEVAEQGEEEKSAEKKSGISNINLFLIILIIFLAIACLWIGCNTLTINGVPL